MQSKTQKPLRKQMYIIHASCWKCHKPITLALIDGNPEINRGQVYGPESFSEAEMKLAENNNVIIKTHRSGTMQQEYNANTCPHCGTFSGQHYHFEYLTDAQYGHYQYTSLDIE